ncbi:MAG: acetylxylan esterase [Lachnospiraceae bacterium]|nr:acetylxylan esterase [Lachnospiraceae bacterium]
MNPFDYYPSEKELEAWIGAIWEKADASPCTAVSLNDSGIRIRFGSFHMNRSTLIRFEMPGFRSFYGMWTPALKGPAPLVVHTPGYGAELSFHPDVVGAGYNVLELSPLGYWTPDGDRSELNWFGNAEPFLWPVLPNTAIDAYDPEGYFGWIVNVVGAVRWAMKNPTVIPDRVSFFGTSQGGGASLLLGSVFRDHGTRCVCADEPFLTNYPASLWRGAYFAAKEGFVKVPENEGWHNLGFADTLSHAYRMTYPVLLTLGTGDDTCPPDTIRPLFDKLDTDKMLLSLKDRWHGYQYEFIRHALTWFELYA